MSVLSLFHPNPYDTTSARPGYAARPKPKPVKRPEIVPESEETKDKDAKEPDSTSPTFRKPLDPSIKFVEHKLTPTEDLSIWSIAAMYGVSPDAIQRYNRRAVFEYLDNMIGEILYIPVNVKDGDRPIRVPEVDPKKEAEYKFVKDTGASHDEAKFYLTEAEWDFDGAIRQYNEDTEWEQRNGGATNPEIAALTAQLKDQMKAAIPPPKKTSILTRLLSKKKTTVTSSTSSLLVSEPVSFVDHDHIDPPSYVQLSDSLPPSESIIPLPAYTPPAGEVGSSDQSVAMTALPESRKSQ